MGEGSDAQRIIKCTRWHGRLAPHRRGRIDSAAPTEERFGFTVQTMDLSVIQTQVGSGALSTPASCVGGERRLPDSQSPYFV